MICRYVLYRDGTLYGNREKDKLKVYPGKMSERYFKTYRKDIREMGKLSWDQWYVDFDLFFKKSDLGESTEEEGDEILRRLSDLVLITRRSENGKREINELYRYFWRFFSTFCEREQRERIRMIRFFADTGFFYQLIQILYLSTTFEMYLEELLLFFSGIPTEMEEERFFLKVYIFPFLPGDVQANIMEKLKGRILQLPYPVIENGLLGGMIRYDDSVRKILRYEMKKRCEEGADDTEGGLRILDQCKRGNPVYLLVSLFLYERITKAELYQYVDYFESAPYLGYAADPQKYYLQIRDFGWEALFTKDLYRRQQKDEKLRRLKEHLAL